MPRLIDEVPPQRLTVEWPPNVNVQVGQVVLTRNMLKRPKLSWPAEYGAFYTVMILDGGIERLLPKFYTHWLVMNIPGGNLQDGIEFFEYVPPFSFTLTDEGLEDPGEAHPMMILVFKQSQGKIDKVTEHQIGCTPEIVGGRIIDLSEFKEKYGLELIAGNFLRCP